MNETPIKCNNMADFQIFAPFLSSWEGGYVNNKNDNGGETYRGVTIATWTAYCVRKGISTPLKKMSQAQWEEIMKGGYWDAVHASELRSQSVANQVADFAVNAGVNRAAITLQQAVNTTNHNTELKVDGVIGAKTLAAANALNPPTLYWAYRELRTNFYKKLAAKSVKQAMFLKGWRRRVQMLNYRYFQLADLKSTRINFEDH